MGDAPNAEWSSICRRCITCGSDRPLRAVEATMSRYRRQMGMARLRVRGMSEITYVSMLRALSLNIHRVAAYRTAVG